MTTQNNRPGAVNTGAVNVNSPRRDDTTTVPPTPDNPRQVRFVLCVDITGRDDREARSIVQLATAAAPAGAWVRLRVGSSIPLWFASVLRTDLRWQIEVGDACDFVAWTDYLGESA